MSVRHVLDVNFKLSLYRNATSLVGGVQATEE